MKTFEKVSKQYALENSYFKFRLASWPDSIGEIYDYLEQHGELPFRYTGDNWIYDAMCERQKRKGVAFSQYLTPDSIAELMADLSRQYLPTDISTLEPCCGTGQLIRALMKVGYGQEMITAFDIDPQMAALCARIYPQTDIFCGDFRKVELYGMNIIANPPFETAICTPFLTWLGSVQFHGNVAVLLLPNGFIDRTKPNDIGRVMEQYEILNRKKLGPVFKNNGCYPEIVVLRHL